MSGGGVSVVDDAARVFTLRVPGDKSISHRVLLTALLARGPCTLRGLPEGLDVRATRAACVTLGAAVEAGHDDDGAFLRVTPPAALRTRETIDCQNAGTLARLLCGLLVGQGVAATLTGDASLSRRPMRRVAEPLNAWAGVDVVTAAVTATAMGSELRLPLSVHAHKPLAAGVTLDVTVPSAQVISALLYAALPCNGPVTVVHPGARDHTERLLRALGARIDVEENADGRKRTTLHGPFVPEAFSARVPGDPSSAAFFLALAATLPGCATAAPDVLLNPWRTAFVDVLAAMGAKATRVQEEALRLGEPVGSLRVDGAMLRGTTVNAPVIPALVDELPALVVAAACAAGPTRFCGLSELRHKEADRLVGLQRLCVACGVGADVEGDDLIVHGVGADAVGRGPARVVYDSEGDHRLHMAAACLCARRGSVFVDRHGDDSAAVSLPGFQALLDDARAAWGLR